MGPGSVGPGGPQGHSTADMSDSSKDGYISLNFPVYFDFTDNAGLMYCL